MGDATGTALAHGNLAATYMVAADPQAGFGHAQAALLLHADMRSDEGVHAAIAAVNFGASAAWLGQLDLAVPALHRALHTLGPHSGAAAMAKASIAAAAVDWMRGEPENGLLQLATVTPPAPAPMVLQAHLWCARCAQALGRARQAQGHVRQARAWWAAQPALWSVPGALADWAPYGNAAAMLGPLHAQAQRCEAERLPGLARGLWFGWLVHASKTDARAALPVALRLLEELSMGFSAGLYPPAVWLALSDVFVRARRSAPAEQARDLALRWLLQARLPDGEQAALRFASANPVNRHLLVTPG